MCPRFIDALEAGGQRKVRRREDQSQCRFLSEMLKDFIDVWTFGDVLAPAFGEELRESI